MQKKIQAIWSHCEAPLFGQRGHLKPGRPSSNPCLLELVADSRVLTISCRSPKPVGKCSRWIFRSQTNQSQRQCSHTSQHTFSDWKNHRLDLMEKEGGSLSKTSVFCEFYDLLISLDASVGSTGLCWCFLSEGKSYFCQLQIRQFAQCPAVNRTTLN